MSQKRAAPLAPEQRRASIVSAALPLLRQYGSNVTTAQIAMAAGVAEGTLFRVFPDKDAIVGAAIETAFDPAPDERALAAIDRDLRLREKLIAAVQIIQRRVERVWALIVVLGPLAMPRPDRPPHGPDVHKDAGIRREIAALFALHAEELRCAPEFAERILRMLAFAGGHPRINDGTNLTAEEVVAVVLDGVRARADLEDDVQGPASPGRAALPKGSAKVKVQ